MSILTVLTSPFVLSLLVTAFVTFPLPLILNYTILENFTSYGFEIVSVCIFIVTFCLGTLLAYNASVRECDKYKKSVCFGQGFRQAIYSVIIYLIVFFIPFFKSGFTDIGGNNMFWNSIGEGFILGMSNIVISIGNYFTAKYQGCLLSTEEAEQAFLSMETDLSSRAEEPEEETTTITS